ncbi:MULTISPECIES: DMT family transporter [unclassified Paenibacillus]|uniref:DMT family transporter n=1 Tax=unclassified Paenibacillus TaxID=185978 RepID=UPI00091F0DCC|nr:MULTISPECIES: DMT family transporter [unclassified Paenibacillus]SHN59449.1 Permease of the drug/metabolite transporter (DMT) superfamily [Paenibacillus sp. ov031]SLJ87895.1 Permease of the drug/metabolite transporter (DMT) superfamily [Paenibacillus sp. RU5A]SOC65444.1 Permease of the drug/metabolite transporter (DMT) superfamily [Paenibacillus sp. RU26A]SOC68656.1 Permease of the drug/metabolite transporter (DMT) superfamily [Paenibacillus sp. RU5M]
MTKEDSSRVGTVKDRYFLAIGAAVLVTLLWSTSYILNKFAFQHNIGPFTLAGLRYTVSAITLLLIRLILVNRTMIMPKPDTQKGNARIKLRPYYLVILGVTGYLMAQGLQYAGQMFITPTQTSMILSVGNTAALLILDVFWLRELRGRSSFIGIMAALAGIVVFYFPWDFGKSHFSGIVLILASCAGYAIHLAFTRHLLKNGRAKPGDLVLIPMSIGAFGMLIIGLLFEGLPSFSWPLIGILLWLGIINGSFAFSLWTWSQKHLRAYENSLINNLMLLEVTVLDVLFLHRNLSFVEVLGLLMAGLAIVFVQIYSHLKRLTQ